MTQEALLKEPCACNKGPKLIIRISMNDKGKNCQCVMTKKTAALKQSGGP